MASHFLQRLILNFVTDDLIIGCRPLPANTPSGVLPVSSNWRRVSALKQIVKNIYSCITYRLACIFLGLAGLLAVEHATAASHTWAGVGLDGFWSLPANWQANNPPSAAEAPPVTIIFPSGAARLNNTNNLGGLVIDQLNITGSGYTINGSGAGTDLAFKGGASNFTISGANAVLANTLNITLSNSVPFSISGDLTVYSKLLGSGGFSLSGSSGALALNSIGDNQFTGPVAVTNGTLYLHNGYPLFSTWVPAIAVPGALTVGGTNMALSPTVILLADSQLAANCPLTLNPDGYFMLNGHSNELGSVTMTGGSLYGGSVTNATIGTLRLQGNIAAFFTPFIINSALSANLNLGGVTRTVDIASNAVLNLSGVIDDGFASGVRGTAGITKTSPGTLNLFGANTYNGVTTVSAGTLALYNNSALGTTNVGTTVASGAQLYLTGGINIGAEPLTLNGSGPNGTGALAAALANICGGQITLASDSTINTANSTAQITFDGVLTGSGGVTKTGLGTVTYFADFADTYAGATFVTAGTLKLYCGTSGSPQVAVPGYLEIGGGSNVTTVQLLANSQLSATATLQVDNDGVLDLNNNSATCGPLVFNGIGPLVQSGTGTLTLNGDVSGDGGTFTGILSLGGASRQFNITQNSGYLFMSATVIDGGSSAGIINNGSGGIILKAANSFSGQTVINSGTVNAWDDHSFGTGAGGVVVNGGGHLNLGYGGNSPVTISNVNLTLNSGGDFSSGYDTLTSYGSNNWVGPINLASDSLTGCPSNSVLNINGPISGPGNLFVGGLYDFDGVTIFSGANDNTFAGTLTVSGFNMLQLNKSGGATAVPGALVIGNDTDPEGSANVQLEANNQIANSAVVTIKPSGEFSLRNYSETIGPLMLSGGIIGSGLLTLNGNVTNDDANGLGQLSCPLSLGGQTRVFNMLAGSIIVAESISDGGGSAGITKTGSDSFQLVASNSFSGTLTINAGEVYAADNHALGAVSGGVVLNEGATLFLDSVQITNKLLTVNSSSDANIVYYGTNLWTGPVTLNGPLFCPNYSAPSDQLTFSNVISGTGGITVEGNGWCIFSGTQDNIFTGLTLVSSGVLNLQKTAGHAAIPGSLTIGDSFDAPFTAQVMLSANEQIKTSPGNSIQINNSGYLNLNTHTETVPQLNLWDGALVDSGLGGLLILNSNVKVNAVNGGAAAISGNLSLGGTNRALNFSTNTLLTINAVISDGGNGAGFTARGTNGSAYLGLSGANTFAGTLIADGSQIFAYNSLAFGGTAAGVVLTNGGILNCYVSITNEPLTTAGTLPCSVQSSGSNFWSGPIQLQTDTYFYVGTSNSAFMVTGPVGGTANLFPSGIGTVSFAGSAVNLLTGTINSSVNVLELARIGSTAVYGSLQITGGTVRWKTSNEILDSSSVTVTAPGVADLNSFNETIGDFSGNGTVLLGSGLLAVGGANPTNTFSGTITGNALCELDKVAGNTLVLSGANNYSGNTLVKGGTLLANGSPTANDVYVYPGATLGGTGTIGNLYDLGGNVNPGNSVGKLNCSYATFNTGSTLFVNLNGTNLATGFNQLNVTGVVTINSGVNLSLTKTFAGTVSNQFVIVNNDLADAVAGTFAGLTNGATFTASGTSFRINYNGSTGNDIVLTQLTGGGASLLGGISTLGNGSVLFTGTGVPNLPYTVQANTNLATAIWINIGTTNASAAGVLQFTDPNAPGFKQRFYRFSYP